MYSHVDELLVLVLHVGSPAAQPLPVVNGAAVRTPLV